MVRVIRKVTVLCNLFWNVKIATLVIKECIKLKKIFYAVSCMLLIACATNIHYAKAKIAAASFLNPNVYRQASPVVVTIYQLKSATAFEQANFFELTQNPQDALGSDFIDKEEIEVQPGQQQRLKIALLPTVHYLGVVAAFRNMDMSQWRQVKAIKSERDIGISIHLATQSILVDE
jgi:type VI secretion system protein VasD